MPRPHHKFLLSWSGLAGAWWVLGELSLARIQGVRVQSNECDLGPRMSHFPQTGSSLYIPSPCRCFLRRQCPVNSPTTNLIWFLDKISRPDVSLFENLLIIFFACLWPGVCFQAILALLWAPRSTVLLVVFFVIPQKGSGQRRGSSAPNFANKF
jgi:hypothetical protein